MENKKTQKVALVHEFITQLGGAERVLKEFLQIYPGAVLHTLIYNGARTENLFSYYQKKYSFLQFLPWSQNHHRWYLPLMPWATESFNFKEYDMVLADASAFAKGVKVGSETLLVCYCHTPTRYLWLNEKDYLNSLNYPGPIHFFIKLFTPPILSWLRRWDYKAAQKPHHFIANSKTVQERIEKYYDRESVVVFPPVDTEFFHPVGEKDNYFFAASRLEPYKKIELVVEAFNDLGLPLKVAGSGTASEKLRAMAKPNIEFLGRISDEELRRRYSESLAYVFPANEDAGIMPLEAMACGTPVIAYRAGGASETVVENKTGLFFDEQTSVAVKKAVNEFNKNDFDKEFIRSHAMQFDKVIFRQKIKKLIDGWYGDFKQENKA